MRKLTFSGGIHPDDTKSLTAHLPIEEIAPPKLLYFPAQQHIGAPPEIIVDVGDSVRLGQALTKSEAFVFAPLSSSVSGTVKDIGLYPHPNGTKVPTIVIENDGLDTPAEPLNTKPLEELSPQEIVRLVRNAGLVGMGGAGFPTHVKLSPPPEKTITDIIINGAECEPYLTSDHRLMLECAKDVIVGTLAVMKVFSLDTATIAIEENKPDAIAAVSEEAKKVSGIRIAVLKKKYPQGAEKQLIYAVTGRQVPSGGLPADIGAVVLNVGTTAEIARVIEDGTPLYRRVVTVSGNAVAEPKNQLLRIGTPFSYAIEQSGGFSAPPTKIIMGGPMMGIATCSQDVPVVKGTSGILALSDAEATWRNESACLRCGRCTSVCPMGLVPSALTAYANLKDLEQCEKYHIMDCMECGSCSYVCPAQRHLIQSIRWAKSELSKKRAAMKK